MGYTGQSKPAINISTVHFTLMTTCFAQQLTESIAK